MSMATPNQYKNHLNRWFGIVFMVFMVACNDDNSPEQITFTGEITGKDASGQILPLAFFPIEVGLYESPFTLEPATIVSAATGADGRYELTVEPGKYKAYTIVESGMYYGSCTEVWGAALQSRIVSNNEDNFSLCIVSGFKLVMQKGIGSSNTLTVSYLRKKGDIYYGEPGKQVTDTKETVLEFTSSVIEVWFTFTIKNSSGQVINTINETKVPVMGSTQTIHVDF